MTRPHYPADLHRAILRRDRMCFLYRLSPLHQCMTTYGREHSPLDQELLTVDEFWLHPGGTKGKRAPQDLEHGVAMCGRENIRPPSHGTREAERSYIEMLYPGAREREETRSKIG